jgi:hypothetical protein
MSYLKLTKKPYLERKDKGNSSQSLILGLAFRAALVAKI